VSRSPAEPPRRRQLSRHNEFLPVPPRQTRIFLHPLPDREGQLGWRDGMSCDRRVFRLDTKNNFPRVR